MKWIVGALAAAAVAGQQAPAYAPISTKVCATGGPQGIMPSLPRLDRKGRAVSADLGSYPVLSGVGAPIQLIINASGIYRLPPINSPFTPAVGTSPDGAPNTLLAYIDGVGLYLALGLVMALASIAFTAAFCIARYCCCCCPRNTCCCVCFQCGVHEPTTRFCGCGTVPVEVEDSDSPTKPSILMGPARRTSSTTDRHVRYMYPRIEVILTYALLVCFLAFVVSFVIIGLVLGFQGIPTAAKEVSPTLTAAIMPLAESLIEKMQNLAIVAGSTVIGPQLLQFNQTLQSGLSLAVVETQLTCVIDTVASLPDINTVVNTANTMNTSLTTLRGGVNGLVSQVNSILSSRTNLTSAVNTLSATVASLGTSLGAVTTALNSVNTSITPVVDTQTQLVGPGGSPLIPALQADLTKLQPDVGLPNATIIASTSGPADVNDVSGSGTLNRWIKNTMNGLFNEQGVLIGRLGAINGSVAGILGPTNFSLTADRLLAIDALATAMRVTHIPALSAAITSAESAVSALPRASSVLPSVYAIDNTTRAITFAGIIQQLQVVRGVLNSLPSIPSLVALVDSAANAASVLPCANNLIGEIRRLNATLVVLPSAMGSLLDVFNTANASINTALGQLNSIRATLNSTQAQINAVNISGYIADANAAWATVNTSLASFNMASVISRVSALDTSIPVNFTALRASLASLNTTLTTVTLNTTLATTLRSFETDKRAFIANMSLVLADMRIVERGYCSSVTTTLCLVNGDCPSGTCDRRGVYRCADSPAANCLRDADCGSGRCLADFTRALGVKVGLDIMAGAPSVTSSLSTLTSMSSATSSVDLGAMRGSIATANASIGAVSTASIAAQLTTVNNSLAQLNTDTISSAVSSVQSAVNAVDFGSFMPQITSMSSTITSLQSQVNNMGTVARNLVRSMSRFLNVDLGTTANRLSAASLSAARATGGTGGLVQALVSPLQDVINSLQSNTSGTNASALFAIPSINLTDVLPSADTMNRYTGSGAYAANKAAGLIHFAMSAVSPSGVVALGDTTAYTIFTNNQGAEYPDGKRCYTDACITATIDYYTSVSIGQFAPAAPLAITPLAVLNLVWLLPAFVVILGFSGLFSRCCCKRPEWQKCPVSCMTGCIMMQMPMCFCIAAFLFPMAIVVGDVCASGRNVPYAFVQANSPGICAYAGGTYASATGECAMGRSITLPDTIGGGTVSLSGSIDPPGYLRALLGDGQCGATDPWAAPLATILSTMRTEPFNIMTRMMARNLGSFGTPNDMLRPPMLNLLYNATNVTANALVDWATDFTGTVTTCPRMNGAFLQVLGIVCCSLYKPLYWLASVFFLLGWAYCCCGMPAGILARKRLTTHPWGSLSKQPVAPPAPLGPDGQPQGHEGGELPGVSVLTPGDSGTVTASAIAAADAAVAAAAAGMADPRNGGVAVPLSPHPNVTVRHPRPVSAGSTPIGHGMIDTGVDGGDFGGSGSANGGHVHAASAFPPQPVTGPAIMPGVGGVPGYPYLSPTAAALAAAGGGGGGMRPTHMYGPSGGGMAMMMPSPGMMYAPHAYMSPTGGMGQRGSMAGGLEMSPMGAAVAAVNPMSVATAGATSDDISKRPGSAGGALGRVV